MHLKTLAAMATLAAFPVLADNVLHPGTPVLDRPTLTTLGVQLPITGDDNFNATVTVLYRPSGTTAWRQALPLFRVHPENTVLYTVAPQFAGSIFDLMPATSYDIQLNAVDPDGPVNQTFNLTATTRPVPSDPPSPRIVNVNSLASLNAALGSAQPGDIIQLADAVYNVGSIFFFGGGTAQNPIVIRGTTEDGTILDGGNCTGCNIIEVYGSYVHIERMTLRNAERAIRFYNVTQGNVVRRVHVKNTTLGIHGNNGQLDYYIADNILEGRLAWPLNYSADNGLHAADTGITAPGFGNVVAHNQISGYGDAMQVNQEGSRSIDFYGNDILWTYDNGIELDSSEGNTRAFRNRFTNAWDTLSVQPILGGPAYLFRNVVVNAADEQMKFHALNTSPPQEPNGVLSYHNTFVSPNIDLNLCTPNASHHFWIENNLFVGPAALNNTLNKAVLWCGPVDDGHFDYNGYWPDGGFSFNLPVTGGYAWSNWANFAGAQAGGLETHGTLLPGLIFASGIIGQQNSAILTPPQDVTLASGSSAIDRGLVLPNINDGFTGSAPDLGALEAGCPSPVYGPRPLGMDETNEPLGCTSAAPPPNVGVTLTPSTVSLSANQSQTFTVTVTGTSDSRVSWTVTPPNAGSFANGTYAAPAVIAAQQTVTITATSVADNTKSASSTVTLTPPIYTGSDLAQGKPATQSSTLAGYGPSTVAASAVDGNTDGNFFDGSVSHTNLEPSPWWQVDLGAPTAIGTISIWPRTDCCSNRLSDYWVFVSNTPFGPTDTPASLQGRSGTWGSHQTSYPNPSTTISVNATGRYVRVQLSGSDYLSLAEVQVFGSGAVSPTLYSISGQITLSGTGLNGIAVNLTGGQSATSGTSGSGNYSFAGLTAANNYTVTPTLNGYTFTPPSQTFNALSANQTANFTAAAVSSVNLALGKTASQSSTLGGFGAITAASSAIDGNTDGNFYDGSVSHTSLDSNAWWQVDLGAPASIGSIAIWNRTDCCGDRLNDYWVFVSNTPFLPTDTPATLQNRAGTLSSHQISYPNPSSTIAVNGQGRYVRVQLSGSNYLSLAEVQVFGSGSAPPPPTTYQISGQVTLSGAALSGVSFALSGAQSASVTSNAAGSYSFTGLAASGNYTVTPTLSGYTFTPPSQTYNTLSANQTANFTATGVVTGATNLALGKPATQSSTLAGYGSATAASNAVDGKTDGNFAVGSVSHTDMVGDSWWQVDLGATATISSIAIWNRTDCCSNRLSDYWVFVSNTPFLATDTPVTLQTRAGTWNSHQTSYPNPSTSIPVNAAGRYVRVQLSSTNYLSLAEVQIFGQ